MLETRSGAQRAPRTSLEWCAYYAANAVAANVPWTAPVRLTDDERRAIAASVQQFQLGESSEGRHLHAAARVYAARTGDEAYVSAIEAFIREEQRHARDLGRFLTAEGIPLTKESWPDAVFRWLRRGAGLEVTVSVLLTAEIIAQVYYAALRDATRSPILRALCDRILADEAAHVRFQAERLGTLRAGRGRVGVRLAVAAQRTLFAATALIVWNGHRPALERGGFFFRRYWRECWERFGDAAEMMRPVGGDARRGRATDVRRQATSGRRRAKARRRVIPSERQRVEESPPSR
jgi:rubrerythrin